MLTIDALKEFGADTDDGVARCFGNEEFYLKLVETVPDEPNFGLLFEAVEGGDLKSAFEHAHALKGVLANLSLTPILTPVTEITERLRAEEPMDYNSLIDEIIKKKEELNSLL